MSFRNYILPLIAFSLLYFYINDCMDHSKTGPPSRILKARLDVGESLQKQKSSKISNDVENVTENNTDNLYIYYKGSSRLGNQLFQYSSTTGIAKHNSRKPIFDPTLLNLKKLFPELEINTKPVENMEKWPKIREIASLEFDEKFCALPKKNLSVGTYLQSFLYFENINPMLKKKFSMVNGTIKAKVDKFMGASKNNFSRSFNVSIESITTVCIHVRRGDYVELAKNNYGRTISSLAEIKFAMEYMKNTFRNVIFIVSSNGKNWCSENLGAPNVYMSTLRSPLDDLALLSSCDHMIMTVGTYGWWSGWLTSLRGGTVMYKRDPFKPGSKLIRRFNRTSHFPGHWLAYNNMSVVQSSLLNS